MPVPGPPVGFIVAGPPVVERFFIIFFAAIFFEVAFDTFIFFIFFFDTALKSCAVAAVTPDFSEACRVRLRRGSRRPGEKHGGESEHVGRTHGMILSAPRHRAASWLPGRDAQPNAGRGNAVPRTRCALFDRPIFFGNKVRALCPLCNPPPRWV